MIEIKALNKKKLPLQSLTAKMKKIFVLTVSMSIFYLGVAQSISKVFRTVQWEENFKSINGVWSQTSTAQNAFLQTEEGYNIWRKNEINGFVLLPQRDDTYDFFETSVSFEFDKKQGKKQHAGIVMQAQEGGTGAVIVELNRRKQYRIRRVTNNRYVNITEGKDGWIKNKSINSKSDFILKVVTKDRLYDVYVNDKFITTFTEVEYTQGHIGLYVGESSRAIFKQLIIKSDEESDNFLNTGPALTQQEILTQSIIKLRETINKKDQQIARLENEVRQGKGAVSQDSATIANLSELRSNARKQSSEISSLQTQNEALMQQVKNLQAFKNEIKASESGDIIINFTNLTTSLKQKLEAQENTIRLQTEAIEKLKNETYQQNRTVSAAELQNTRNLQTIERLQQKINETDSTRVEIEYQNNNMRKELNELRKLTNSEEKSDKKKRKAKNTEEQPEFIIED
jgi:hypothetical protein